MTNFKRYLSYRLKSSFLRTLIFSLISVFITYVYVTMNAKPFLAIGAVEYRGHTGIELFTSMMAVLCILVPVLETAGFKNKRNLDTFYSLPLSRFNLALAHYLSGFVQILAVYTVSFITAVLVLLTYAEYFGLICLPAFYVLSVIFGLGVYSFYMFVFGQANTVFDGAVFCAMWSYGTMIFVGYITDIISNVFTEGMTATFYNDLLEIPWLIGFPFSSLDNLNMMFRFSIEPKNVEPLEYELVMRHYWSFFLWAAIYVACAYGYFRTFMRKGAENAGEISDTWFGYRLLIPIYGFLMVRQGGFDILTVIWLTMMVIGYVIYRRGLKLKKSDIVVLAIYAAVFFVFVGIFNVTAEAILFFASIVFFIVSACLFLGAAKENREKQGFHGEREMMKLGTMLVVSAAIFLIGLIQIMWPIIVFLFSLSVVA